MRTLTRAGLAVPVFRSNALASVLRAEQLAGGRPAAPLAEDETYWGEIQRAFDADRTLINLNNGGVSPTPTHVLEAMIRDLRFSNEVPVEHMWGVLEPRIESVRRELAKEFGCDTEEMAITRNASESNETMILGLDLKRGDEVIVTTQNYGRMMTTWDQRARRDGIVVKQIKFTVPPPSDDYIVDQFREAITPRTRVIEITHITNLTGQILPVREGRRRWRGEKGHRGVRRRRACVRALPVHARRARVRLLRHQPAQMAARADRHRLPLRSEVEAEVALAAHGGAGEHGREHPEVRGDRHASGGESQRHRGGARVPSRASAASGRSRGSATCAIAGRSGCMAESSRVRVLTPLERQAGWWHRAVQRRRASTARSCKAWLWTKHRIITTPIIHAEFNGLRITPNVYTTLDEVDRFGDKVLEAVAHGVNV